MTSAHLDQIPRGSASGPFELNPVLLQELERHVARYRLCRRLGVPFEVSLGDLPAAGESLVRSIAEPLGIKVERECGTVNLRNM